MAKIVYRGNLSAAIYPMTLAGSGRAVIMPGPDQNFDRRVDPQGEQKDAGIPQAIYMENVLPTVSGYQSVGFLEPKIPLPVVAPNGIAGLFEVDVVIAANVFKTPLFYLINDTYTCGALGTGTVTFVGDRPFYPAVGPPNPIGILLALTLLANTSSAVVGTKAYLRVDSQLYEVTGSSIENITLTNVTASITPLNFMVTASIVAIAGSNNYLIMASGKTIYYSSLTNPLDFVSSLISGAGQGDPNNLKGPIVSLAETQNGFYILAQESTILAKYTNNNRYPWRYVVVRNVSGRVSGPGSFYGNVNSKAQYVLDTNNQVKIINEDVGEDIGPEVGEFLANGVVQQLYNTVSNTFEQQIKLTRNARIYVLSERYIFISINDNEVAGDYSAAIVYDILLKRYGKVNIRHHAIYELTANRINTSGGNVRKTIGFLNTVSSKISVLNIGPYATTDNGLYLEYNILPQNSILVLGKFQYARSRFIKLEEIDIEGLKDSEINAQQNFSCYLLPSLDGYNFLAGEFLVPRLNSKGLVKYKAHKTCQNFALALKGSFDVSTTQLAFTVAGER